MGRAPATALAYMQWIRGMQLDEAFTQLTSLRRCGPKVWVAGVVYTLQAAGHLCWLQLILKSMLVWAEHQVLSHTTEQVVTGCCFLHRLRPSGPPHPTCCWALSL
jgi:hypothetical protein